MTVKKCKKCSLLLLSNLFYKKGKGLTSQYKNCILTTQKHKRLQNPEEFREKRRKHYQCNASHINAKQQERIANWSPEKRAEYNKRRTIYQATNGYDKAYARRQRYKFKKSYGISLEDYELLQIQQNNSCAICKMPETKFNKRLNCFFKLSVDHDHLTGKVRGLLCHNCNAGIGNLRDNISLLENAVSYLKSFL